jgi:hypothetical protein
MSRILRHRPSPALVVACIALAVALTGTSYAALRLPANSVGPKQLRKNAVTAPKIRNNAVTGAKVKGKSLTGADIQEDTLGQVPSAAQADTATSATSATNADTSANATGLDGPLASGKTLRGNFALAGIHKAGEVDDEDAVSFAVPLASAPQFNYRAPGVASDETCPGSAAEPAAAPGNACFYEVQAANSTGVLTFRNPNRFGATFFPVVTADGSYVVRGTWAVTAP